MFYAPNFVGLDMCKSLDSPKLVRTKNLAIIKKLSVFTQPGIGTILTDSEVFNTRSQYPCDRNSLFFIKY